MSDASRAALDVTLLPKRRVVHKVPGASPTALPSQLRCPSLTLTRWGFPGWLICVSSTRGTAVYGPVRTVVSQGLRATAYLCQLYESAQKFSISQTLFSPVSCSRSTWRPSGDWMAHQKRVFLSASSSTR